VRVLACQLSKMPHDTATVDDLRRQGKWADLYQINVAIDASFAAANLSGTDAATAELVQDYLALHLCIRDFPPNRPTALRLLSIQPGFCLACADAACLGNRVLAVDDGYEVVFEHHKTRARTQAPIRLRVAGSTATAKLLSDYISTRRSLLVKTDTQALFLSRRGDAFTESSFSDYMPRLLSNLGLGHLSYTTVRPGGVALKFSRFSLLTAASHRRRRGRRIRGTRRNRRCVLSWQMLCP